MSSTWYQINIMIKPTVMRREAPSSIRTGVLVHTMRDARESKDAVRLRNSRGGEEGRLLGKCLVLVYATCLIVVKKNDQDERCFSLAYTPYAVFYKLMTPNECRFRKAKRFFPQCVLRLCSTGAKFVVPRLLGLSQG